MGPDGEGLAHCVYYGKELQDSGTGRRETGNHLRMKIFFRVRFIILFPAEAKSHSLRFRFPDMFYSCFHTAFSITTTGSGLCRL